MKKRAVEWLVEQVFGEHTNQWQLEIDQALEMEREQLCEMSVKSAIHERKWIAEAGFGGIYEASKTEINELKKTAKKHFKETYNKK